MQHREPHFDLQGCSWQAAEAAARQGVAALARRRLQLLGAGWAALGQHRVGQFGAPPAALGIDVEAVQRVARRVGGVAQGGCHGGGGANRDRVLTGGSPQDQTNCGGGAVHADRLVPTGPKLRPVCR